MMFRKKERRKVPGLNTTSTADISFMLLILFLVASSMDLDIRIAINAENQVTLDGKPASMNEIKQRTMQLVESSGKGHLIQLQSDRNASYDTYLHVQNQLVAAYNTIRNQKSMNLFGKEFDLCSNEQQTQIAYEVPIRITEVYVASNSNEVKKGDTK